MTQKKNSESQDSCRQWQQMLLFEPLPKLDDAKAISNAQRSSTAQSRRSERNFRTTSVHRQIVTVNDSGRAIGEDHVNAIYLNSDVENARQLRAQGYTYLQISQMLDMPIRTLRDYLSGRRRCQSVAGWKVFERRW